MAAEKYAFVALVIVTFAFMGFVFTNGANAGANAPTALQGAQAQPQQQQAAAQTGANAPTAAQGTQPGGATAGQATVQEVSLTATGFGYDKNEIRVKAGAPVHFTFTAINAGCGSQLILDRVGVNLVSQGNTVDATFTPPTPGNYPYHCGMNMFRGVLVAE